MNKPVRKAVRVFLLEKNKVVVIKYFTENQLGYYDIPGGKIEDGETGLDAAIREYKEETGMDIFNLNYAGNLIVDYPNKVFDFDVYICHDYYGIPQKTLECDSMWIEIDELLEKEKLFSNIYLLNNKYYEYLIDANNFKIKFICSSNHNILEEILY